MGNKSRMKPGKNELIRRTNVLLDEIERLNGLMEYVHGIATEYITWKGDEDKFKQHLEEKANANKEKGGEFHESSGSDSKTRKGESGTKKGKKGSVSTHRNTTKRSKIKETGESGSIGV